MCFQDSYWSIILCVHCPEYWYREGRNGFSRWNSSPRAILLLQVSEFSLSALRGDEDWPWMLLFIFLLISFAMRMSVKLNINIQITWVCFKIWKGGVNECFLGTISVHLLHMIAPDCMSMMYRLWGCQTGLLRTQLSYYYSC